MNSPAVDVVIWANTELPSLVKPKLVRINVRNMCKPLRFGGFREPNNMTPFTIIDIREPIHSPRTECLQLN